MKKLSNYEKVLNMFFDNPSGTFHVREVARITGLNPNTVLNIVEGLVKEKLVKRDKKKHIVELSANVDDKFRQIKRIANLNKIYESGVVGFLSEKFNAEAIVIMGSYSFGEDIQRSDVDILVITKEDYKSLDLSKFEKALKRKIHLVTVYYDKISDEFFNNSINGIVVYGYIRKK